MSLSFLSIFFFNKRGSIIAEKTSKDDISDQFNDQMRFFPRYLTVLLYIGAEGCSLKSWCYISTKNRLY